jgi:hypothetical protein
MLSRAALELANQRLEEISTTVVAIMLAPLNVLKGATMNKPIVSHRRIDQLRAIASDCGFTSEDAKRFGKLSRTATWEALLETYGIPPQVVDTVDKVDKSFDLNRLTQGIIQLLGLESWAGYLQKLCCCVPVNSKTCSASGGLSLLRIFQVEC